MNKMFYVMRQVDSMFDLQIHVYTIIEPPREKTNNLHNCEADQRLCFRYKNSTIPLLSKSKISSLEPSSVTVQAGLCQTCLETTLLVFPRGGAYVALI